jgi:hypothetical protein
MSRSQSEHEAVHPGTKGPDPGGGQAASQVGRGGRELRVRLQAPVSRDGQDRWGPDDSPGRASDLAGHLVGDLVVDAQRSGRARRSSTRPAANFPGDLRYRQVSLGRIGGPLRRLVSIDSAAPLPLAISMCETLAAGPPNRRDGRRSQVSAQAVIRPARKADGQLCRPTKQSPAIFGREAVSDGPGCRSAP